jgi:hypothetical protein
MTDDLLPFAEAGTGIAPTATRGFLGTAPSSFHNGPRHCIHWIRSGHDAFGGGSQTTRQGTIHSSYAQRVEGSRQQKALESNPNESRT